MLVNGNFGRELRVYFGEVDKAMFCNRKEKTAVLTQLKQRVEDYIAENNPASFAEIMQHFGTPEALAADFIGTAEPRKIRKITNIKKIIVAVSVVLVGAFVTYLSFEFVDSAMSRRGTYEKTVIDNGTAYVSDGSNIEDGE